MAGVVSQACHGKRQYTAIEAHLIVLRKDKRKVSGRGRRDRVGSEAYRCLECGRWHIGHVFGGMKGMRR